MDIRDPSSVNASNGCRYYITFLDAFFKFIGFISFITNLKH